MKQRIERKYRAFGKVVALPRPGYCCSAACCSAGRLTGVKPYRSNCGLLMGLYYCSRVQPAVTRHFADLWNDMR